MKNLFTMTILISTIFTQQGKIIGKTFFDFTSNQEEMGFNFKRQYFGYSLSASDEVSFKVLFDVGRTESDKLSSFLKKAQINYVSKWGKTSFGLIGINMHSVQEKNWGYRFIEKSAIDLNKFSSSGDLGIAFSKSLLNNLYSTIHFVNGEGYKKPQSENTKYFKSILNVTYGESELHNNNGYNLGFVYSLENTDNEPETVVSLFGGLANLGFRLGIEYSLLKKTIEEIQVDKFSIISSTINYAINDKINLFARYDLADKNATTTIDNQESAIGRSENYKSLIITGAILNCGSGLSVAPNVRLASFEDSDKDKIIYRINAQFKF